MIQTITLDQLNPESVSNYGVVKIDSSAQLCPQELVNISRKLGKPYPFNLSKYRPKDFPSEVILIDNRGDGITSAKAGFGEGWHQDSTYLMKPPAFTMLHALDVPSNGGETLFADTRLALASISKSDFHILRSLYLEHSVQGSYKISENDVGQTFDEIRSKLPKAIHPVLFNHPYVGNTLYLSPLYTKNGLKKKIASLIDRVLNEVIKNQIVHKWKNGQILVWDNRVVMHAASKYLGNERRRLIRTVIHDICPVLT